MAFHRTVAYTGFLDDARAYYLADMAGFPDASTEQSSIPHQCPVCDNARASRALDDVSDSCFPFI